MRISALIDIHILLIDNLTVEEGFNRGRLVDLTDKVVKLGSTKLLPIIKGRTSQECKVSSTSWNQTNEPVRALSHGHCVTSARNATWVTIVMHKIVITVEKLDTWPETVRTATIVGNLAILLEIVLIKEKSSRSRVMQKSMPWHKEK